MRFYIMYSILLLGGFMTNIVAHSATTHVMCETIYNEVQRLRNNAIRLILSDELNRTKNKLIVVKRMIDRTVMNKYNNVLSRYYDVNYNYNSLTYAEKTLLEVIVSLTY